MAKTLMIGSCEPFSGKSALTLGIARHLKSCNIPVRFGKPLATSLEFDSENNLSPPFIDDDVRFIGSIIGLSEDNLIPSVDFIAPISAEKRLAESCLDPLDGFTLLKNKLNDSFKGLNILEAAGTINEGLLYGLSLAQLAKDFDAKVLLVHLWKDSRSVDSLLAAKKELGETLLGVVLNAVTPDEVKDLEHNVVPALRKLGVDVFGVMPRSPLLRSVTVEELVRRLDARVICCSERLELMVETLSIGAMSVNSAMEFFRKRRNMAVVTGADRTDIQLAALEASTQCLILTGAGEPLPQLINRAEELEVPLLKVDTDTLSTVEVIEHAFGHVRLHESVKASYAFRLVDEHCDLERLFGFFSIPSKSADHC
ncbi:MULTISPECIES: phosphotransacetylase family protein [unclassified Prochlorococcus]|uniref:phosphotransacetylase family protein n=1 Tax=unclassified Prochlorococcus TaxID=2627481 RepID=UPI0005337800|nr:MULTISPECIES: phosphotransacetylase family protein [unclassified Prochlorococcus]KGG16481.1 BioD-like N-terminal domain of phosphotransacetylase [Prochlorococcus sp. MIT 0602]KGG17044.1 BioD-like N-terminal domain of phosphotransacetylase [Prochlorococcus sp. MIT 0603]